MQASK